MGKAKQTTDGGRVVSTAAPLAKLAKRINGEHEKIEDAYRRGLESARAIGQMLLEAKKLAGHRHWQSWLADHVDFRERTAQNYMRLAAKWDEVASKSAVSADLTIDSAFRLLASKRSPEPERTPTIIDQVAGGSALVVPRATVDETSDCQGPPESRMDPSAAEQPAPTAPAAESSSHQGLLFNEPTGPGAYGDVQVVSSTPPPEPARAVEPAERSVEQPAMSPALPPWRERMDALLAARARHDEALARFGELWDASEIEGMDTTAIDILEAIQEEHEALSSFNETLFERISGVPAEINT